VWTIVKSKYNSLKKRVLKVLSEQEKWVSVSTIAFQANLPYSERGLYPYLRRLAQFGLVAIARGQRRRVYYQITERGRDRLKFLTKEQPPKG
jgi:DNA-binding PadR family transcriptional regulator